MNTSSDRIRTQRRNDNYCRKRKKTPIFGFVWPRGVMNIMQVENLELKGCITLQNDDEDEEVARRNHKISLPVCGR